MSPPKFNASEPTPKMPNLAKKKSFQAMIKKENAARKKEFDFQKACLKHDDDKKINSLADSLGKTKITK